MTTATYTKTIRFDRETRDFAMYLDGEFIGYAPSHHAAEVALDALVAEKIAHYDHVEEPAPVALPTMFTPVSDTASLAHVSIPLTADSRIELSEADIGSQRWCGLLVDDQFYGLAFWKHTVGRPEVWRSLQVAYDQACAIRDGLKAAEATATILSGEGLYSLELDEALGYCGDTYADELSAYESKAEYEADLDRLNEQPTDPYRITPAAGERVAAWYGEELLGAFPNEFAAQRRIEEHRANPDAPDFHITREDVTRVVGHPQQIYRVFAHNRTVLSACELTELDALSILFGGLPPRLVMRRFWRERQERIRAIVERSATLALRDAPSVELAMAVFAVQRRLILPTRFYRGTSRRNAVRLGVQ